MAFVEGTGDDPSRSIQLNFDFRFSGQFNPLLDWLTREIVRFHEDELGRPRPNTINQISTTIDCLLANLLNAHRISSACFVAISMTRGEYTRSQYQQSHIGYDNLVRVVEFLRNSTPPYIIFHRGFHDRRGGRHVGRVSRIKGTERLLNLIRGYQHQVDQGLLNRGEFNMNAVIYDIGQYTHYNPLPAAGRIAVPASTTSYVSTSDVIRLKNADGDLVEYDNTDVTNGMRERLTRWNEFTSRHHWIDLLVSDDELEHLYERNPEEELQRDAFSFGDDPQGPQYVDLTSVRLHRVFNRESFEKGGRFYGGWWQRVPAKYRRYITINGHPTKEFDYSNLHPAMLYARRGLPLAEDAYSLPDIDRAYRSLIKATFFKLVNALEGQRIRPPRDDALPPGVTWAQLQEAVREKHAPIAQDLNTGVGLELQRVDSDIAEQAMWTMMAADILILPVHDSFITYHGADERLLAEMRRAYRDRMQAEINVDADPTFFEDVGEEAPEWAGYDFIDNRQAQPGYEAYRLRRAEFFHTRDESWRYRFG